MKGAAKWFVKDFMQQNTQSERLGMFIQEIIKGHFSSIVSIGAFSIGFIILLFYRSSHNVPSNIFTELSINDFLFMFACGVVWFLMPLYLLIVPSFILASEKPADQFGATHQKSWIIILEGAWNTLKNLSLGNKIFFCIYMIIDFVLLFLLFFKTLIIEKQELFCLSIVLAVLFSSILLLMFLSIPVDWKGITIRIVFIVALFALFGNITATIVRFSGYGNQPICLVLNKDNENIVKLFTSIFPEDFKNTKDKFSYTPKPLHLVFQTKEHLYLQGYKNGKPEGTIFQVLAVDNHPFSPSGEKESLYCIPK